MLQHIFKINQLFFCIDIYVSINELFNLSVTYKVLALAVTTGYEKYGID